MDKFIELVTKDTKSLLLSFSMLLAACLGAMFLFVYDESLFNKLDIIKMIMLIIANVFPVILIASFSCYILSEKSKKYIAKDILIYACLTSGAIITSLIIFSNIVCMVWFDSINRDYYITMDLLAISIIAIIKWVRYILTNKTSK